MGSAELAELDELVGSAELVETELEELDELIVSAELVDMEVLDELDEVEEAVELVALDVALELSTQVKHAWSYPWYHELPAGANPN